MSFTIAFLFILFNITLVILMIFSKTLYTVSPSVSLSYYHTSFSLGLHVLFFYPKTSVPAASPWSFGSTMVSTSAIQLRLYIFSIPQLCHGQCLLGPLPWIHCHILSPRCCFLSGMFVTCLSSYYFLLWIITLLDYILLRLLHVHHTVIATVLVFSKPAYILRMLILLTSTARQYISFWINNKLNGILIRWPMSCFVISSWLFIVFLFSCT